ncbi:ABC transporter ATP-binding protein [Paenibacillus lutrae]|uniref:ATP-binding cassette domain-containing protein n=1 Tax=Paenibacillus lutrae TaxID=2078573 RepID=A0A7X3JZ22_9BACL|nr:ABC transporter ATP-binding protein [Paenibacillus lutrae]MVO99617.1 ATP-binding cassette domain-containing protein [Paenibacillus lutrae]
MAQKDLVSEAAVLPDAVSRSADCEGTPPAAARTDLDEAGMPAERWFVATSRRMAVYQADGSCVLGFALTDVRHVRTQAAPQGGGLLIADTSAGSTVLARYSAACSRQVETAVYAAGLLLEGAAGPEADTSGSCSVCGETVSAGAEHSCIAAEAAPPAARGGRRVVLRLLAYTRPYRGRMAAAALFLLIAAGLELVPPFVTKIIVDEVLQPGGAVQMLTVWVAALLASRFLLTGLQIARGYIGVKVGASMMNDIRRETYEALTEQSLSFYDRRQTAPFIGRLNQDTDAMRQFLTEGVIFVASQVLTVIAIVTMMLSLSWKLTLLVLLPTPLLLIGVWFLWPLVRRLWYKQWRAIQTINTIVGDSLQGIRVVKAFGREKREQARYREANGELMTQTIRMESLWQAAAPLFMLVTGIGGVIVWYYGGLQVVDGSLTLGTLMAFTVYLTMFFGPLQWFTQAISWTNRAMSAAERVFEIIDTPREVADSPDAVLPGRIEGSVRIERVTYGYEKHRPVLRDISLDVKPGEMIGLVGHSGAGKSTLIHLICRFYDPDRGQIRIDGIPLTKLSQESLRAQIGVVLQETFLFDGTIAENIAYAKPEASPLEIIRAAKIANAHDFIVGMSDGYDTRVGERGHRLSGGEKQRVAIARAILHDPRILILDEATASVDTETERLIQEAIARLIKGRTTFAIAHRLSTLRSADRLVVIDKGLMAETGTHQELMKQEGIYYKLVKAQSETVLMKEREETADII